MLSRSRVMCTPYSPLLCFYERLALYNPSISQNKGSTRCVGLSLSLSLSLSLQLLLQKRHGLSKKREKYMDTPMFKYWKKKRKKGPWRSLNKNKEEEEEIVMLSEKLIERERDHTKGVSISSTIIHTRAHLDMIVWFVFLFGSYFWLCKCDTSIPYPL